MPDRSPDLARTGHIDRFCRDHLPPRELWPELVFDIDDVRYPGRLNCAGELLDRVIDQVGPERTCLLTPAGESWTYGQVRGAVDRVALVLRERFGVVPGNRILLRAPNNPWLVICWFATLKVGAVAVTTMPLLRPTELSTVAEIARIDLALCDDRFVDDLRLAELAGAPVVTFDELRTLSAKQSSEHFTPVETAADDVALLAFTSGTTGRPKATMHFHRDVLAVADTFGKHIVQMTADDVVTGTPPLAFTFGLGGLLVFPMRVGAATLLLERATPDELADAIAAHGVTVCFTAPTAYKAMLAVGAADRLRHLRRAVAAGEHLPKSTWQAFYDATGVRIIDGIGSTEILHVFISAADDDIRPGATGVAVPGYRATILDADGRPVPAGTPGRLAVKGPTGCRYLADDRQRQYVQDGWNLTGDVFVQDAEGYFSYLARGDDMIVSSGYNIAGPEVEEALNAHPAVAECAVVGAPDEARGQLVKAYVVLADGVVGDDALAAELQDFVKRAIAPYKYPRVIDFLPALPRTTTGKVQRFMLRDLAAAETGS
jgi:2-aminobenzoate-CoA ligase